MKGIEHFFILEGIVNCFLLPTTSLEDENLPQIVGPKEARMAGEIIREYGRDNRLAKALKIIDIYVDQYSHRAGSEENYSKLNLLRKNLDFIVRTDVEELVNHLNLKQAILFHMKACFLSNEDLMKKASTLISLHQAQRNQKAS